MIYLEDKEYNNIYAIPANYTDSGKILGGMLEPRNAIEAVIHAGNHTNCRHDCDASANSGCRHDGN